jgi:hypothetical protein
MKPIEEQHAHVHPDRRTHHSGIVGGLSRYTKTNSITPNVHRRRMRDAHALLQSFNKEDSDETDHSFYWHARSCSRSRAAQERSKSEVKRDFEKDSIKQLLKLHQRCRKHPKRSLRSERSVIALERGIQIVPRIPEQSAVSRMISIQASTS